MQIVKFTKRTQYGHIARIKPNEKCTYHHGNAKRRRTSLRPQSRWLRFFKCREAPIFNALDPPAIMLESEHLLRRSWEVHGDARIRNAATPEIPVSKLLARRLV